MQIDGLSSRRAQARALFAGLLLSLPLAGQSQETIPVADAGQGIPDDYYRAELVILERRIEPAAVNEFMSTQKVEPTPETESTLQAIAQDGTVETTLELAPTSELSLNSAAQRLVNSGRYRVLVNAGWYQAFPPDYEGEPLKVAVGDWLERAGIREIEGTITIDRQRYLHVDVHLNHWQYNESATAPDMTALSPGEAGVNSGETAMASEEAPAAANANAAIGTDAQGEAEDGIQMTEQGNIQPGFTGAPLELLTWIRETRRMRSEEIHFLDSPTIGVLVFFKKIEATE
ncbi:CsiV family protein [Marinobacter sp. chi1]|uniref:CsiV family protein n=1 Tax=Marinobacter suaedae TaxID=3057675 RepID=A0ABT8VWA0_9GAMM|nr:CsiV family protein [Marinobacter sp. chi1]MDO3720210.1 CsiV family protein [Marinobacter sp. chi1]